MVHLLHVALLSLILTFSGTFVGAQRNENDIAAQQDILNFYKDVWSKAGVSDYKYAYEELGCSTCYSLGFPWSTIVSTSPQYPQKKAIDTKAINRGGNSQKVEDIFNTIQLALYPQAQGGAEAVKVDYDPTIGYPMKSVFIWTRDVYNTTETMTSFEQRSGPPEIEYQNGKALWESQRIYDYIFKYTDYGPNIYGLAWPLTVSVRSRQVVETRDATGALVSPTFFVPPTMDGFLDLIGRNLVENAPYVDAVYSKRGFPEGTLQILTWSQGFLHYFITEWNYL